KARVHTRVVCRVRGHREDRAVAGPERDDRAGVGGPAALQLRLVDAVQDPPLRGALEVDVERELDRLAGRSHPLHDGLAVWKAERVHPLLLLSRASPQVRVVRGLEPGLADLLSALVALAPKVLQLVRRDLR